VHAAADAGRRLVDRRRDALVGERQRGVETGDAAADDRDSRRAGRARPLREKGGAGDGAEPGDGAALQEVAAVVGGIGRPPAQLGGRKTMDVCGAVVLRKPPQSTEKRCPRHAGTISHFRAIRQED
jgi:hypothetical protein